MCLEAAEGQAGAGHAKGEAAGDCHGALGVGLPLD